MTTVGDILNYLETLAPPAMKMDWDNVGLLCGGKSRPVTKVLVALDPFEGVCRRNAANYGLSGKIDFFLCDGVQGLPRDFDVLICAGMGADTMISILEAAPWLQGGNYRLIFQCQSKTPSLRKFFSETGWEITRETALRDGRFLYTVMEVLWNPAAPRLTPGQCYFSPALARCNAPEAAEYRRWVLDLLRLAAKHRPEDEICQALAELEETT